MGGSRRRLEGGRHLAEQRPGGFRRRPADSGGPRALSRLPAAVRLLLVLTLWAAITLSFGIWQLVGALDRVSEASQARDIAVAGLSTVTLIERLQDERDIASQVRAADPEHQKLRDSYLATDQARDEFESSVRPLPRDLFGSQVDEILTGIANLEELRSQAFDEGSPPAATIEGYGDLIVPLIRLNERSAERAVALSRQDTVTPTAGVSVLLLAAEALAQQRTAITTILARDQSTAEERQALRTSATIASHGLATFRSDAAPPLLTVYQQAGDEAAAAEADRFAAQIVESDGPYTTAGLAPATWASVSSDRLNQIRLTVWTASVDLIDRAAAELDRHRLTAGVSTVVGAGVVLIAGIAVVSARRVLFARTAGPPAPNPDPGWRDPLPCRLSHRNQELLDEQLALISQLESTETDPDRLAALFQLDHLATRMRRHGENLISVTGQPPPRRWPRSLTLLEILQAAVSESHRYDRVKLTEPPVVAIRANAVIDTIHLLAELLDNATAADLAQSVTVFAAMGDDERVSIEIHDQGPGMPFPRRALINARLTGAVPDDPTGAETGLRIVALLASRHGIEVKLTDPATGGLTATVTLPATLLATAAPDPLADDPPSDTGYDQPGYDQPGYDQPGYDQPGYDQPGYDPAAPARSQTEPYLG